MIHNMTEERKKTNRCDVSFPAPLTEEELARLIETVEERELLHAPGHLKENVLSQLHADRARVKNRTLFSYRVKVLAGMAAALTVLFLVPVESPETADVPRTGMQGTLYSEETQNEDEWEQDILDRRQDIEKTWERYRKGQERADARRHYVRQFTEKFKNRKNWEE